MSMTHTQAAYQPSGTLGRKIARRLVPFQKRIMLDFKLKRSIVSFTFDDFPRSCIENGARVLEREGWRGSFYVAAGLEGVHNHHGENFLASDLVELESNGHEIGSHTFSHMDCTQYGIEAVLADIDRNEQALREMGVRGDLRHFAFPYGEASPVLKAKLSRRYKTLRGIRPGIHWRSVDLMGVKSSLIASGEALKTSLRLIEQLGKKPGWLSLFTHDIRENPSAWGCTPDEFIQIVNAVKAVGADVLPVGAAIKMLENGNG
ncbi:MAG TPA: polysaccharide deacetylase [Hellea balneolensis]|uniref:Chitooligosaccharide deacetylase n=1 Tax=Hellea balneolensis TaxID=287478 RepID=A0A7V5U0Z1_9PROT|nr:polysaccharide deacetylase [Hellea balneolensis]